MKSLCIIIVLTLTLNSVFSDTNVNLPFLFKCCSINQYVTSVDGIKKVCMDLHSDEQLNYTQFSMFLINHEKEKTGKILNGVFTIVPGKFHTDEDFHNDSVFSLSMVLRKYTPYLSESANLYLVRPNTYSKWNFKIAPNNFCVDFFLNWRHQALRPAFWIRSDNEPEETNDDFSTAAMLVSCFFLLLVLVVYTLLPKLRNMCGMILMAYVSSLLVALLLLAVIRLKDYTQDICYGLTLAIYYSFLSSFCWMNVMSCDIWWTFRTIKYAQSQPRNRSHVNVCKFLIYCIYAWGLPLTLTVMMAWIDTIDLAGQPWFVKPNLHNECFIADGEKLYYLYIPMLILICANWTFYLMTAFNIWRIRRGTSVLDSAAVGTPAAHRNHRQRFVLYIKLSVVMGLNWIFEVFTSLVPNVYLWYITGLFNILIGVSIFVIFVCKRKIMRNLLMLYLHHTHGKSQWRPKISTRNNTSTSDSNLQKQTLQGCDNSKRCEYVVVNNF